MFLSEKKSFYEFYYRYSVLGTCTNLYYKLAVQYPYYY